jgi:hypothetical protein
LSATSNHHQEGLRQQAPSLNVPVATLDPVPAAPARGTIFKFWSVAPGDPAGRDKIRAIVEESVEHVFEFDVQ